MWVGLGGFELDHLEEQVGVGHEVPDRFQRPVNGRESSAPT